MNKLFNADGTETPDRPYHYNDEVKELIIKKAVNSIFNEKHCDFDEDEKEDLQTSLISHWSPYIDGYDLAKDFESDCWDVDRNFVDKLDNVCGYISSALRDEEKKWADDNDIVPPFNIGDKLNIGIITGFHSYGAASYLVLVNGDPESSTSRRIIKFEDAIPEIKEIK